MKNVKKLGFILGVGAVAAFATIGCSDDTTTPTPGTAGQATGGSAAGMTNTAGQTMGGSAAGATTGGGGAGGDKGGAGGGGAGGAAAGAGGSGGAAAGAAGMGGKGGAGGMGGMGGMAGMAGMAGAGGGGGAPSADCMKWCSGDMSVVKFCMGSGLADAVNTEQKCIDHCTATEASGIMGLACWNTHLQNAINMPAMKMDHCKHASGAPGNGQCNETK